MKIKHVLKPEEFADILKTSAKARGKKLSLYVKVKKEDNRESFAVGIVISRRFVKRAVTRNYLRRLIYAYFRDQGDSLKTGNKIIVRVTGQLEKLGRKSLSGEIRKDLETLVLRRGLKKR